MALGAGASDVVRLVLGQSLRLIGGGVAIGLAGLLSLTRYLSTLLFRVSAIDPVIFALVLGAAAILASLISIWRAATIDPVRALRQE